MDSSSVKSAESELPARKWNLSPFAAKAIVYALSLLFFIGISMVFYCNYEGWTPEIAFSFAVVTLSTVGYGYHAPSDDTSRLFTIFFMLFGVYFVFAGINELIALHMRNVAYQSQQQSGTAGEKYIYTRRRFAKNIAVILLVLLAGALVLMACEGWSFITALYFAIETTTTIGYGDLGMPKPHTRAFLCLYILISCGLVSYAFSNLHLMKNGLKLLNEDEKRALKRQSLQFMMALDTGSGVSRAEFLLAILEQQGVINAERDIRPWSEKFNEMDVTRTGRVFKKELEVFHRREAVLASSRLEEINRDRSASITPLSLPPLPPLLSAAERVLRTPWSSMDEGGGRFRGAAAGSSISSSTSNIGGGGGGGRSRSSSDSRSYSNSQSFTVSFNDARTPMLAAEEHA